MIRLKTHELVRTADVLATDLINYARNNGVSIHDLLMVVAFSERLLHEALCSSNPRAGLDAMQEADATFIAVSTKLEAN